MPGSSQLQRWSHIDDSIQPMRQLPVLRRARAEIRAALLQVTKELFDAHSGRESDEDASRPLAVIDKRVWNATRSEDRIARSQPNALFADLDNVFTREAVELLVLLTREQRQAVSRRCELNRSVE